MMRSAIIPPYACIIPLGGMMLTPAGYAHMTALLATLAGGKLVVALEGGYNLRSTSRCAE